MKLKRQAPSPPTDLLDEFIKTRDMLDDMLQGGSIAQASVQLSDARRHECVATIAQVIAQLQTFSRVIAATGQLIAQMRLSGCQETAFLVEDDMRIIVDPPKEQS